MQGKQTREGSSNDDLRHPIHNFKTGDPYYALYSGQKQTKHPKWVPALVFKQTGTRTGQVRAVPKCGSWRRHSVELRPRRSLAEDDEPSKGYSFKIGTPPNAEQNNNQSESSTQRRTRIFSPRIYKHFGTFTRLGPFDPRRSKRARKQRTFYGCTLTDY